VICLANSDGGDVFVGVEDDGTVTGLHAAHRNVGGLAAMIANSTVPPLSVRVEALEVEGHSVAKITVPKSRQLVATSEGLLQRRRIKADGLPECVPFYPHEFARRQSDLGLVDYSALPVTAATPEDFDPLERERLRQAVERYGGDRSLLGLSDDELDGALGLACFEEGRPAPDYSRTTPLTVTVLLSGASADIGLLRTIIAEERRLRHALPIESLSALGLLRQERRADTTRLARQIQRDEHAARKVLERLVEAGLVQAHGARKGRTYTLSPKIYQLTAETAAYVRQAGFDPIQQEQMVFQYVRTHGRISRRDAAALCQIGGFQAGRLLKKLVEDKKLVPQGKGRTASYKLP
jgi:predicted HTH transcriptional regulator